jgi:putative zinc finger protein
VNCLDAETLAAWMDGGLSGAALDDVQSHVAGCARCQALVGAMGRTRVAVPPTQSERAPRWWLAWAVPLTAAATAAAIWIAVPRQTNVAPPASTPRAEQKQEATAPAAPPSSAAPSPNEIAAPKAAPQLQGRARPAETPPSARREAANEVAQPKLDTLSETASAPPAAPPAASSPAIAPPATASPSAAAARRGGIAGQIQARTMAAVAANSFCGNGWPPPPAEAGREITAGSAPSADVCWMAGRGGTVLRSTDHQTWQRANFPEPVDLSAINSTDARMATVVTIDGRTFTTSDGGATWAAR